jgi:WD40 repeat protein
LWDARTGKSSRKLIGHTDSVWGVAFSPDGSRLASAGDDGLVRVWDVGTGELLLTLAGHTGSVWGVAFSPDGSRLASAGDDGTARLWDSRSGQPIWLAVGFPGNAAASWSPSDDRLLATAGDAWRYLRAACFDENGRLLGLQPFERYYFASHGGGRTPSAVE